MKIAVFTDLHAHPFPNYSYVLPNGLNSRLVDAVTCIKQIRRYCVAKEVDLVLFGGDLFHERKHVVTQAFNAVYEQMASFVTAGIPLVMIHGNHDQADKEGRHHSIHTMRSFATVIDEPSFIRVAGASGSEITLFAVPYVEEAEHLKGVLKAEIDREEEIPNIFLGHIGLKGAKAGADFIYRNPAECSIDDIDCGKFDVGFLGHFHMRQKVSDNFYYVGAPMQHDWGDVGQARGFMVYDTDTKLVTFVKLNAPRFEQLTMDDVADGGRLRARALKDCFVRVVSEQPMSQDQREWLQQEIGARKVEVAPPPKNGTMEQRERLSYTPGSSYQELARAYVASGLVDADGLDEEFLIDLADQFLQEAKL